MFVDEALLWVPRLLWQEHAHTGWAFVDLFFPAYPFLSVFRRKILLTEPQRQWHFNLFIRPSFQYLRVLFKTFQSLVRQGTCNICIQTNTTFWRCHVKLRIQRIWNEQFLGLVLQAPVQHQSPCAGRNSREKPAVRCVAHHRQGPAQPPGRPQNHPHERHAQRREVLQVLWWAMQQQLAATTGKIKIPLNV